MIRFRTDKTLEGKSLKEYFQMQKFSSAQIKRWKYGGKISVNGEVVTVGYVLHEGDTVELFSQPQNTLAPAEQKAEMPFFDDYLYVAYKPYGVAIHPDRAHRNDTFGNRLAATFGPNFELRVVTRLDKTTSGLVLGALDAVTAQRLNQLQAEHKIQKQYVACVEGKMTEKRGVIDLPLLRIDEQNKTVADEKGKRSVTRFEVLKNRDGSEEENAATSTLLLTPLTGRTHQIRAHLAAVGHPIVGDVLYGAQPNGRVMLHCARLTFEHPVTREKVDVYSPPQF